MSIVQGHESNANDPRWVLLRVSRINLLISGTGVLVALAMLVLVPMPTWLRPVLAIFFFAAFLWDLRFILLKSNQSVNALYLFDLEARQGLAQSSLQPAKLGICVRYAVASGLLGARESQGIILGGAFVSPWFTTVRYALPEDPRWRKWWPHIIPIWPDAIEADAFRHLRVALKWK